VYVSLCIAVQLISIAIMITGVNSMLIVTLLVLYSWRLVLGPLFFEIALISTGLQFDIYKKDSMRSSKSTDLFMFNQAVAGLITFHIGNVSIMLRCCYRGINDRVTSNYTNSYEASYREFSGIPARSR
jgi:hypothetical protein